VTRCCGVVTSVGGEVAPGWERDEMIPTGLTQILLSQKMKKNHVIDSSAVGTLKTGYPRIQPLS
jgi:hypothetical protein